MVCCLSGCGTNAAAGGGDTGPAAGRTGRQAPTLSRRFRSGPFRVDRGPGPVARAVLTESGWAGSSRDVVAGLHGPGLAKSRVQSFTWSGGEAVGTWCLLSVEADRAGLAACDDPSYAWGPGAPPWSGIPII